MRRAALLIALIAASGLFAMSPGAQPALACSGPGPIDTLLYAQLIFEGRVSGVEPLPGEPLSFGLRDHAITFDVVRNHRGTVEGERLETTGGIPVPGVPIMCPQFPQDLLGKYVVIGATTDLPGGTAVSAWNMVFIGDEPVGVDYQQAVRLVEMIADSNPEAPQLQFEAPVAACGQPARLQGVRFPEGRYLLRYSFGRGIAVVDVDVGGTIDVTTTFADPSCRTSNGNGRLSGVHVFAPDAANSYAFVEVASTEITGAMDRTPPFEQLSVIPDPAICGQPLTVRGVGFEPSEPLSVQVSGELTAGVLVTADGSGAFDLVRDLPSGSCTQPIIRVAALQRGFEEFGLIAPLAQVWIGSAPDPGPPDAGTGLALTAEDHELPWNEIAMVVALVAAFAGGTVALARSFRSR